MMIIGAVEKFYVQIHARIFTESFEEMFEKTCGHIFCADRCIREFHIPNDANPIGEIDADACERFVHRDKVKAVTFNAFFIAEAFDESFAQTNRNVFEGMMHINVGIAVTFHV